jgi:hypothetical protein
MLTSSSREMSGPQGLRTNFLPHILVVAWMMAEVLEQMISTSPAAQVEQQDKSPAYMHLADGRDAGSLPPKTAMNTAAACLAPLVQEPQGVLVHGMQTEAV